MPGQQSNRDIVVIGGSAGALQSLLEIARHLPPDLQASFLVAMHISPDNPGILPTLLTRVGTFRAEHPLDREPIKPRTIYVAPPDVHLLLKAGHLRLTNGPTENGHRPAIDPLFRTAARARDGRTLGVILSGALDDGTRGLRAIIGAC